MKFLCSLLVILSVVVPFTADAGVPGTISYQGVLTDAGGSAVPDGDYSLTFRLYDTPSGGSHLWEETKVVTVSKGIFSAILGAPSGISLPFDDQYYLGISVGGEAELDPRIELTSSAYSITSRGLVGSTNTVPPDGNTGIGTLSPAEKLEVAGGIKLGSTGGANAGTIRWSGTDFEGYDGGSWRSFTETGEGMPSGTAGQTLRHNGSSWVPSSMIFNDGSNVGINSLAPGEKLEVGGSIKAAASVKASTFTAGTASSDGKVEVYGNGIVSNLLDSNMEGGYLLLYDENNNNIISLNPDVTGGILRVRRNETNTGFEVDGNFNGTENPRVRIIGASTCIFSMDETGDASVQLPTNAISAGELMNEPGVTSSTPGTTNILIGSGFTILGSQSITVPAGGYVLVMSTMLIQINFAGSESHYNLGISSATDTVPTAYCHIVSLPTATAMGYHYRPVTLQRLFSAASPGTYTYYMLAKRGSTSGNAWAQRVHITCVYLPTAYGSIAAASGEDSGLGGGRTAERGLTPADVEAVRAASEAANMTRIENELEEMRARLRALEAEEEN